MPTLADIGIADRLRKIVISQDGGARCRIMSEEECRCGLCDVDRMMSTISALEQHLEQFGVRERK